MPAPNLPNALLKLGVAVAKHYLKKVIGDEVVQEIATMLTDVSEEEIKAKIDSILTNKEGQKQLLKEARTADQCFKKKCKEKDLRQLFTMAHGDLSSVQTAFGGLPEAVDDEFFRETLFKVFRSELPKRVSNDRVNEGITLYIECLQSALVPIKDFGLRVLHTELREIGKDVKDIKADVKLLLEKTKTDSQSLTGSTNRSDDRIRQEMDLLELPLVYGGFYGRDKDFVAIVDLVSSLKGKQKLLSVTGL